MNVCLCNSSSQMIQLTLKKLMHRSWKFLTLPICLLRASSFDSYSFSSFFMHKNKFRVYIDKERENKIKRLFRVRGFFMFLCLRTCAQVNGSRWVKKRNEKMFAEEMTIHRNIFLLIFWHYIYYTTRTIWWWNEGARFLLDCTENTNRWCLD